MKHILMVDDRPESLQHIGEMLQGEYRISMSQSGEQAVFFLKSTKPDLILLDIHMPGMDGYQTLRNIQSNEETANIPVVFYTADSELESEIKGLNMGAMDFLRKDMASGVLASRIHRVLQIEETRRSLELAANQDILTGLWNRKYMEESINRLTKGEEKRGFFLLLDLDNFKWANDHMGHIAGDQLLIDFAKGIEESIENGIVSRIGGDEFAVLLPDIYEIEKAEQAASRILEETERRIYEQECCRDKVSVSIGITAVSRENRAFQKLYNQADKALYYVKQNGKRGYHFYRPAPQGEYQHEERSVAVDLQQLVEMVEEKFYKQGAYLVERQGFKSIYQFISRYIDRTSQNVQLVLLTLYQESGEGLDAMHMEREMYLLGQQVTGRLRKGDVSNRFSSSQYVVILMDASTENGRNVAQRIIQGYLDIKESPEVAIRYDIREIKTNGEKG
ncbi:MAG: diguanylate cyclase [Lachnospiraceae bacterium]|nr:diguanylate cyclase [Lachnospiraceae bacterium]